MGRGGRRNSAGRPAYKLQTVNCLRLDLRHMVRCGVMARTCASSWSWSRGAERLGDIVIRPQDRYAVRLEYACDGSPANQSIALLYTPCHKGGERVWFRCPGCAGRCAVFFLRSRRFACRECQRVAYPSQSEDALGRSWRAQQKLENRLGPNWERPKGMHHKTRERIVDRISDCQETRENALAGYVARMLGWRGQ